jgi:hypothetical protein
LVAVQVSEETMPAYVWDFCFLFYLFGAKLYSLCKRCVDVINLDVDDYVAVA